MANLQKAIILAPVTLPLFTIVKDSRVEFKILDICFLLLES